MTLIVTEDEFEHGLRCADCHRPIEVGGEYRERLDDTPFIATEVGEAFSVVLVCVGCDGKPA